jgi:hypothetical protein
MSKNPLSLAPGVVTEYVGDDVVVMMPGYPEVVKLSGEAASTVRAIQAGEAPVSSPATLSELVECGVLASQQGVSRRGLVKAGAIGAGAGIAVLSMPGVAAASSREAPAPEGTAPGEAAPEGPKPTQLIGFFSPISDYLNIGSGTSYLLSDPDVQAFLADNGAPNNLPSLPDSFPSTDLSDISDLDVPELGLSNVRFGESGSRLTPGDTYLEWLPQVGSLSSAPFAVIGYFTWDDQEFEVFFFNA